MSFGIFDHASFYPNPHWWKTPSTRLHSTSYFWFAAEPRILEMQIWLCQNFEEIHWLTPLRHSHKVASSSEEYLLIDLIALYDQRWFLLENPGQYSLYRIYYATAANMSRTLVKISTLIITVAKIDVFCKQWKLNQLIVQVIPL